VARKELKTLFCERFACPPEKYEETALWKCLPWYAPLPARLIRMVNRDFFAEDLKFLRYLGAASGGREVQSEILSFQDLNRVKRNVLRTGLRIRVSGRKAAALAQELFAGSARKVPPQE
jgi:hypothetical protein